MVSGPESVPLPISAPKSDGAATPTGQLGDREEEGYRLSPQFQGKDLADREVCRGRGRGGQEEDHAPEPGLGHCAEHTLMKEPLAVELGAGREAFHP